MRPPVEYEALKTGLCRIAPWALVRVRPASSFAQTRSPRRFVNHMSAAEHQPRIHLSNISFVRLCSPQDRVVDFLAVTNRISS